MKNGKDFFKFRSGCLAKRVSATGEGVCGVVEDIRCTDSSVNICPLYYTYQLAINSHKCACNQKAEKTTNTWEILRELH